MTVWTHRPRLGRALGWAGLATAPLWMACPSVEAPPPPVTQCTRLYERCRLPEGPLGVCEQKGMNDDSLVCNSQH